MVDVTKFSNISEFTANTSNINNTNELPLILINNTNELLGKFYINGVVFVIFIFVLYRLINKDNLNSYDIPRGLFISSSIATMLSVFLLISKISNSIYPLYLYGSLMIISGVMVINYKSKGL